MPTRSHEVNVYWCLYFVVRKASAFEDHDETLQMSTKRHYRCQRTVIVASLPPREYRNVNMIRPPSLTCTHIKICVQSIWITYTKYYNNSTKHLQLIKTGTVGYDSKCEIQFEQQESLTISEVLMNVPIKSRFMLICILRDSFTIHFRRTFIANGCGCAARCINIELLFFDSDFALGRTTFKIHPLLPPGQWKDSTDIGVAPCPGVNGNDALSGTVHSSKTKMKHPIGYSDRGGTQKKAAIEPLRQTTNVGMVVPRTFDREGVSLDLSLTTFKRFDVFPLIVRWHARWTL